jgi:hypothetical protein
MSDENRVRTTDPAGPSPRRKAYTTPRLVVYGSVHELTRTEVNTNQRNDMFGNFKTL